jgi:hypothetical protein
MVAIHKVCINTLVHEMSRQLEACPADWRGEILGDLTARLRRNHADATPQALIERRRQQRQGLAASAIAVR